MAQERVDDQLIQIEAGDFSLEGNLVVPENAHGLVLFAHGSGSSRHSPRNRFVAGELQKGGLGTLLFDLLTAEEERVDRVTRHLRFDIALLTKRLIAATDCVLQEALPDLPGANGFRIGYFGSSTGAAAALIAAAERSRVADAVVSRGGRPDLAGDALSRVFTPTLLIVGGQDEPVIGMNQQALEQLATEEKKLEIVPGATHLFQEPGALETVAQLARDWFQRHLQPS